jgi:putative endonuclease
VKQPAVYILASKKNGTLYTGVTSDLIKRIWQHKNTLGQGFAAKYGCEKLVWYELHGSMTAAIQREKQIKAGSRASKGLLIGAMNPDWSDLYEGLLS